MTTTTTSLVTITTAEDGVRTIELAQRALKRAITSVLFAATESARYNLDGVRVEVWNDVIAFVASDGRRLVWHVLKTSYEGERFSFFIPRKAAIELRDMYGADRLATIAVARVRGNLEERDMVRVAWQNGNRKAKTTTADNVVGKFPKWRDIVSQHECTPLSPTGTLKGCVATLKSWFSPSHVLDVRANGDVKIGRDFMKTRGIESTGKFTVSINPKYVLDWLNTLADDDRATLSLVDRDSALWCESRDSETLYILMPCRAADSEAKHIARGIN